MNTNIKTADEKELRELDAWIAEYVMGAEWEVGRGNRNRLILDGNVIFIRERQELRAIGYHGKFNPSSDHATAMQVLEKCIYVCCKDCKTVSIRKGADDFCVFARDHYDRESAEAPTLPLAICRFAQKLFTR